MVLLLPRQMLAEGPQTISVAVSGVVTWDEMLHYDALNPRAREAVQGRVVPIMPAPGGRDLGIPEAPFVAPVVEPSAPVEGPSGFSTSAPVPALGFVALPDNSASIPPDTHGAAGPAHLMAMLNTEVRIQTKVGGSVSTVSLSTFWTSGTGLSGSPFDPRVVYDSISGRWIATVDADANSATSQVWFAISATSDPTLAWSFFGFAADGAGTTWADFPGFGVNATWIAITQNMFTVAASSSFVGAKMWVIDKSTALAGGPLTVTVFPASFDVAGGAFGFALQPTVTFGASGTLHIIDSSGFSSGGVALLRLSSITGTGPAPVWSVQPGSPFAGSGLFLVANNFSYSTIGAEQLGIPSTCSGGTFNGAACFTTADCDPPSSGVCRRIDTGDGRIGTIPTFRNGRIWATHSGGRPVGAVDRTSTLWYQIDPTALPGPIVQSGVIEGAAGAHHYYPSIAANSLDDACVGFSRSDSTKFIEAVSAGRLGSDPLGTMSAVTVLKAGEDAYFKVFSGNRNRWGDYSATVIDPVDDATFWTIQEYAAFDVGAGASDDRWGTWWQRFDVVTPAPTSTPTDTPTPNGTPTPTDTETPTATPGAVCAAAPIGGCLSPGKGILLVKDKAPSGASAKDKLIWKWLKGPAQTQGDFGDPVSGGSSYAVCVYDNTGLVTGVQVPAAGTCSGSACWKAIGTKGYKYKDKSTSNDGVFQILFKGGSAGGSKLLVKAKDANFPMPSLPLDDSTSVTVQLKRLDGPNCWEGVFPGPGVKNEAAQFKDKF